MNEEEYFEQLCSNSVDGTLTDSEKCRLEEHLAVCPSCAALKKDLERMQSLMAVDAEPPAGLHDSIMERLRQENTIRVVEPQKPMRRLPVFTMVAAAAVVVLVVLGGGLMPAFSTVNSGSSASADSAAAEAVTGMADNEMRETVRQAAENGETADSGAAVGGSTRGDSSSMPADPGVQSYSETSDRAADPGDTETAVPPDTGSDSRTVENPDTVMPPEEETAAPVEADSQNTLLLPQSVYGLRAAHCYMAVGGSDLPDIGGELLAQEGGVSWFFLENNMDTLQNTLQIVEQAGYTVSAYDDIGLTIDSRASSWVLAVVTG